jgi:hypothetical protein
MSGKITPVCLDPLDALELGELLEALYDWIGVAIDLAGDGLDGPSFATLDGLRADLARFAFLLGGDGERFVHGGGR